MKRPARARQPHFAPAGPSGNSTTALISELIPMLVKTNPKAPDPSRRLFRATTGISRGGISRRAKSKANPNQEDAP